MKLLDKYFGSVGEMDTILEDDKTHINMVHFRKTDNDPDADHKPEDESLTATEFLMAGTEMLDTVTKAEGDCGGRRQSPGKSLAKHLHLHGPD